MVAPQLQYLRFSLARRMPTPTICSCFFLRIAESMSKKNNGSKCWIGKRGENPPDLNLPQAGLLVLLEVDVDGEMGVDVSHLVLEALGDADDQVVDDGPHRPERSDILARAVVDLNTDNVLLGPREAHGHVVKVLDEFSCALPVRKNKSNIRQHKYPGIKLRGGSVGRRGRRVLDVGLAYLGGPRPSQFST